MAAFNEIQKQRRARIQERKRAAHGDPVTHKLKQRVQPSSLSGKRKRKLLRRWRREQKEAVEKGLVTMEDVEMALAEGTSQKTSEKPQRKFHVKKAARLKLKKLKGKKKKSVNVTPPTGGPVDAMVE